MRINSAVGKEGMVIILSGILRVRHLLKPSLDLQEIRVSYITLQAEHHNLSLSSSNLHNFSRRSKLGLKI